MMHIILLLMWGALQAVTQEERKIDSYIINNIFAKKEISASVYNDFEKMVKTYNQSSGKQQEYEGWLEYAQLIAPEKKSPIIQKIIYKDYKSIVAEPTFENQRLKNKINKFKSISTPELAEQMAKKMGSIKLLTPAEFAKDPTIYDTKNAELNEVRDMLLAYHYRPEPDPSKLSPKDQVKENRAESWLQNAQYQLDQMHESGVSVSEKKKQEQIAALSEEILNNLTKIEKSIAKLKAESIPTSLQINDFKQDIARTKQSLDLYKQLTKQIFDDRRLIYQAEQLLKQLQTKQVAPELLKKLESDIKNAEQEVILKFDKLQKLSHVTVLEIEDLNRTVKKFEDALKRYQDSVKRDYPGAFELLKKINDWITKKSLLIRRSGIASEEEEELERLEEERAINEKETAPKEEVVSPEKAIKATLSMEEFFKKNLEHYAKWEEEIEKNETPQERQQRLKEEAEWGD